MKKLKEVCIFINHTANSGREIRLARKPGICYNRDMEKRVEYTVAASDLPGRVEDILRKRIGLTPHQIRGARYRQEGICLNGVRVRTAEKVREGDRLQVLLEERETGSRDLEAVCGPLEILYEDEDLAAVNKPSGTAVHPAHGHWKDTLANYLRYEYESRQLQVKIRAIGRLDLETSGIVVFAKNQAAAARLWQPGRVEKEYWALAEGHLEKERGRIELPLGKKEGPESDGSAGRRPAGGDRLSGAGTARRRRSGKPEAKDRPDSPDPGSYGGFGPSPAGRRNLRGRYRKNREGGPSLPQGESDTALHRQKPGDRGAAAGGYEETAGKRGSLKKKRRTGGRL